MNSKIPLALTLCRSMVAFPAFCATAATWKAITFGQSTDVNFSSNVLPERVGVNDVTIAGKRLAGRSYSLPGIMPKQISR